MGSPNMNGLSIRYTRTVAALRQPTPVAPNDRRRGRSPWERRGGPLNGPRREPNAPADDVNPDRNAPEPGGPPAA